MGTQVWSWILALVFLASHGASGAAAQSPWSKTTIPSNGPPRVVGFNTNGCIAGARALARTGPGFVVLRPKRNRYWGHPALIEYLQNIARPYEKSGEVLLIADISQPRGGPVGGHASHQSGLDADVRLIILKRGDVGDAYRDKPPHVSMLGPARGKIAARFTHRQTALIRAAARRPEVDRIFVNPVIKRALCARVTGSRGWLRKVVPWYGHDAHMHVRLRCPPGSPACVRQKLLPPGDGCGARLAWWFAKKPARPGKTKTNTRRPKRHMPRACAGLLRR